MEIESANAVVENGQQWAKWDTQDINSSIAVFDLHTAASVGHEESVKQLISRTNIKLDLDRKNKGGWTPLMYAAYCDHDSIVTLLIHHGASVNIRNFSGQSPLMLAAMCGNENCARTLIQEKAHIEDQDTNGCTALFHAASSGHQNIVHLLLQCGANPNVPEKKHGLTPLMVAVSARHESIVKDLLQHGADVNMANFKGETCKSIALSLKYDNILAMLEAYSETRINHHDKTIHDGPLAVANLLQRCQVTKLPTIPLPAQHLFSSPSVFSDALLQQRCQNSCQATDLQSLLMQIGLSSYYKLFEEQDVDLQVFLTLGDAELKEVGVRLLGPRRKMTAAIARWHQKAPIVSNPLEQVFANKVLAEKEELRAMLEESHSRLAQEKQLRLNMEKNLSEMQSRHLECLDTIARQTNQMANLMQQLQILTNTLSQPKAAAADSSAAASSIEALWEKPPGSGTTHTAMADFARCLEGLVEKLTFSLSVVQNVAEKQKILS